MYDGSTLVYRAANRWDGRLFDVGAYAHVSAAVEAAGRMTSVMRAWADAGMSAPVTHVFPEGIPDSDLPLGTVLHKRHNRIVLTWLNPGRKPLTSRGNLPIADRVWRAGGSTAGTRTPSAPISAALTSTRLTSSRSGSLGRHPPNVLEAAVAAVNGNTLDDVNKIRCVALDFGGSIDDRSKARDAGGNHPVEAGAVKALRELHVLGVTLVLSTNTVPGQHRRTALDDAGIGGLFRAVLASDCLGLAKPDPAFYALIPAVAGCEPGEVLHVGDRMEPDVLVPTQCGMQAALIRPRGLKPGESAVLPADVRVIDHVRHLPDMISPTAGPGEAGPGRILDVGSGNPG